MWRLYLGIGVTVAALAMGLYVRHLIIENHSLKTELATANSTVKALDKAAKEKAAIFDKERNRLDEIDQAPDADDGPVAPVLRRTLDGMR